MRRQTYILIFLSLLSGTGMAQTDSLTLSNGDKIVGKVESMAKGVLVFSTDYSENDFEIEWNKVKRIYTETLLYIMLSGGKNFYGRINSISDSKIQITNRDSILYSANKIRVVRLLTYEQNFKDRFEAEINMGFTLARSRNLRQFTAGTLVGYRAKKWKSHLSYNTLISTQDETDTIRRSESEFAFHHIIYKNWYVIPSVKYLANTEQKIKYRVNGQLGFGNFLYQSNKAQLGIKVGINRNLEAFLDETPEKRSWEGFFGSELDLFDTGDLALFMTVTAYPGISEKGRWRLDGNLKFKYDLPLDFYIKLDISLNYDNRPVEGAVEADYVSTIGFGWEW